MSKFIDQARIEVRSGDGGNGIIAWRREKYEPMGGPAGGNGGRGGSVYIEASKDVNTLIDFRQNAKFLAAPGNKGGSALKSGRSAADLTIKVPVGTLVRDIERNLLIVDLSKPEMRVLVAEGGKGGKGNAAFATASRRAPYFCEPGQPGVIRQLELELKLLADVGLVGFPNAGKSTLLAAMSKAKPRIAAYPFSTLEPILGVVKLSGGDGYVMADIPGLLEGAASGVGLGHDFLRHIERTRLILHVVDLTNEDPLASIATINNELALFADSLSEKEQLIVLNKSDLLSNEAVHAVEKKVAQSYKSRQVFVVSAAARKGLKELAFAIEAKLASLPKPKDQTSAEPVLDEHAFARHDDGFVVSRRRKKFFVEGDKVFRLAAVTDTKSPESLHHLNQQLKSMGVIDELLKQQIQVGSEVHIGPLAFTFGEDLF